MGVKSLVDRLASYAEYHRDKRNIATHFVGIPMILVGTQATLAKIGIGPINAAVATTGLATRYYRALDPAYGTAMAAVLGATCALGTAIAALPAAVCYRVRPTRPAGLDQPQRREVRAVAGQHQQVRRSGRGLRG